MFKQPKIFLYHELSNEITNFSNDSHIESFDITHNFNSFSNHLKSISDRYQIVSVEDLIMAKRDNLDISDCALITFDDGYYDSCFFGNSILMSEYKAKGLYFINSSFINDSTVFWLSSLIYNFKNNKESVVDLLKQFNINVADFDIDTFNYVIKNNFSQEVYSASKNLPFKKSKIKTFLTEEDLRKFSKENFCDFGNHTSSHMNILKLSNQKLFDELENTQSFLNNLNCKDKNCFAIPFGVINEHWNAKSIDVINKAGYDYIFSVFKEPKDKEEKSLQNKTLIRHQVPTNIYSKQDMNCFIDYVECAQ
jgi:peptidoglycan/xylan/chitin deacetylase (PgdA/CDA1 family)